VVKAGPRALSHPGTLAIALGVTVAGPITE